MSELTFEPDNDKYRDNRVKEEVDNNENQPREMKIDEN
jgi:hypothetical protein